MEVQEHGAVLHPKQCIVASCPKNGFFHFQRHFIDARQYDTKFVRHAIFHTS